MNKFIIALKRAGIISVGIQIISWFNYYLKTGVIDQFEDIFNEDNIRLSVRIFIAMFVVYYVLLLYFGNRNK